MTKTKKELNELKNEYKTLSTKLKELSEEELNVITGGLGVSAFFGIIVPTFSACQQKNVVNPDDQQIINKD